MRFIKIPKKDWKPFVEDLFNGKVKKIDIDQIHKEVIVSFDSIWMVDDIPTTITDRIIFKCPLINIESSIDADWQLHDKDFEKYYNFLLEHEVNPLQEILNSKFAIKQ